MKRWVWIIGIVVLVAIVFVAGYFGYSNSCGKLTHSCGKCDIKIFGIGVTNKEIECPIGPLGDGEYVLINFTEESGRSKLVSLPSPLTNDSLMSFAKEVFTPGTNVTFGTPEFYKEKEIWMIHFVCANECICNNYGGPEGEIVVNTKDNTSTIGWSNRLANC